MLTNIQNGVYTPLNPCIDNLDLEIEISLAEITYYNRFTNISSALGNNIFRYGRIIYTIANGFYNVCNLSKDYFEPLKMTLSIKSATDLVTIASIRKGFHLGEFGRLFGLMHVIPHPLLDHHKERLTPSVPEQQNYLPSRAVRKFLFTDMVGWQP